MTEATKSNVKRYIIAIAVIVIVVAAGVVAYQAYVAPHPPQKVNFIMDFLPNGSKAPYYVALAKDYWTQQGLDVNVISNSAGSAGAVRAVGASKADFGVADLLTAMTLFKKENITNVRAIAAFYEYNAGVVAFLKNSGINQPKDLEGKTVLDFVGNAAGQVFPIFARLNGVDVSKINREYVSPALVPSGLAGGRANGVLIVSYQLAEVYASLPPGTQVGYFAFKDYGVKSLGHVFLTRTDIINSRPDLVKKFLTGLREGIQYAVQDPKFAAQSVLKYNPQLKTDITLAEWNYTILALGPRSQILNDPQSIGWMDPGSIDASLSTFQQISGSSETASAVFNTQFVTAPKS